MIKLTYDSNEYTFDNNLWLSNDEEVEPELSAKLTAIAYESGAAISSASEIDDTVVTQKKTTRKKKKVKIFDN
tara:strand:- start:1755 stop:1973 length:219 start_codon:yes stop_codon:yes gene_type:complete